MIIFESVARPLLFLHLIAAACAAGAAVHLAIRVWGYLRGRVIKIPHEKLYAHLLLVSYGSCYALGAVVYPTFRIRVRAEYFDRLLPWATGLFEIKEHFATIGLTAVVGAWLLARHLPHPAERAARRWLPLYAGLVGLVLAVVAYNIWSGWYLTTLKAV